MHTLGSAEMLCMFYECQNYEIVHFKPISIYEYYTCFVQFVNTLDDCKRRSIRSKNDFNCVLCKNLHSIAGDCNTIMLTI